MLTLHKANVGTLVRRVLDPLVQYKWSVGTGKDQIMLEPDNAGTVGARKSECWYKARRVLEVVTRESVGTGQEEC